MAPSRHSACVVRLTDGGRELFGTVKGADIMLVLPSADSLWVRLPYLEHAIPAASFWSLIGSVVTLFGTLSIAVVVYRLGQTQFRSNRWWQLQEERYTAIVNELGTIRDAAAKLARYDEPDVMPEDITVTYTPEETEAFRNQILQALDVLRSEIQRGVLLLSPKAIEALRGYVRIAEQPISMEVQYRETAAWRLADKAYNEFAYIAQRDLSAPGSLSARQKAGTAALRSCWARP